MSDLFTLGMVLAAFAGGAFGAAIGALPAFAFTGILVIAGEILGLLQEHLGTDALVGVDLTATVAFGPAFGPHVSFGGGAAAVAYAAKRGYIDPEFEYHPAKYVTAGLGTKPDVLLVGGLFGVFGHLLMASSRTAAIPWDPVAFGVVGSALVHRLVLGYSLVGRPANGWLDMSPNDTESTPSPGNAKPTADGGTQAKDSDRGTGDSPDRPAVEVWLPYQSRWSHVTMLGLVAGMLGAYIAYQTGSAFLAFGISAASLLYINAGVDRVPITHHMTLPASTLVIATVPGASDGATPATLAASLGMNRALVLGAGIGIVGALFGELVQRLFYAHAETHLDPPAASIVLTTLLIAMLAVIGVLPHAAWIPVP